MASLNQCNFIGNAGAAPEIRTFDNGGKVATFNIAVTERWKDRTGNQQESTEWVPLVFNGPLVDVVERFVKKGTPVYVSGKYTTRHYTNAQGVEVYRTEVRVRELQLLGGKPSEAAPSEDRPMSKAEAIREKYHAMAGGAPAPEDGSDDLPF